MLRFTAAAARLRADVFFFPAVSSYFPLPPRQRSVVCFHDTIAEAHPRLIFPDARSRLAWTAKCRLALWQAARVMTVSEASARSLRERFGVSPHRIDVVSEAADPRFHVLTERSAIARTLSRYGIPSHNRTCCMSAA